MLPEPLKSLECSETSVKMIALLNSFLGNIDMAGSRVRNVLKTTHCLTATVDEMTDHKILTLAVFIESAHLLSVFPLQLLQFVCTRKRTSLPLSAMRIDFLLRFSPVLSPEVRVRLRLPLIPEVAIPSGT